MQPKINNSIQPLTLSSNEIQQVLLKDGIIVY